MTETETETEARLRLAPLPTVYHDTLFRSRLEARWAVYFDHIGYSWTYEPDGFDLGPLGWYLPDFLIAGHYYAEVKPGPFTPEQEAKAEALAYMTEQIVIMLAGPPERRVYWFYEGLIGGGTDRDFCVLGPYENRPYWAWCQGEEDIMHQLDRPVVDAALLAARSERFGVHP